MNNTFTFYYYIRLNNVILKLSYLINILVFLISIYIYIKVFVFSPSTNFAFLSRLHFLVKSSIDSQNPVCCVVVP